MLTPTCEESDNSEDQTLDLSPDETQSTAEKEHIVIVSVKSCVEPEPNSDDQLLSHNSHVAESQDHKGGKHGDSGSTRNAELKPQKRLHKSKRHTYNEDISTTLKIRSNTYTGKQCFKCDTCGKDFQFKSMLYRHLRVHTGEKPYPCNTCEKRFCKLDSLKVHMRRHTGEKPYPCNTCERRFYKLDALKEHMRTHTGEKPYNFKTCGRDFRHGHQLKIHMRRHAVRKDSVRCQT